MHRFWYFALIVLFSDFKTSKEHDLENCRKNVSQNTSLIAPETTYTRSVEPPPNQLVSAIRYKRSTVTAKCPQGYQHIDEFCVQITSSLSWKKAFQECYQQGIEKTPLDSRIVWFNATLLANIWRKLPSNTSSVWLAVEQKQENGPIYYSGPVPSEFSYQFNNDKTFNLSWSDTKSKSQKNCLMLDFRKKELVLVPCNTNLPFVCLFPSIFWIRKLVINAFHKHLGNNIFTWEKAKNQCETESTGFTLIPEHISNSNSLINGTKWVGTINTCLHNIPVFGSLASYSDIWFKQIPGSTIYSTLNSTRNCNESDTYYCLDRAMNIAPRILLRKTNACFPNVYQIELENVNRVNSIYEIKCYLNDKQITTNKSSIAISQPGRLFCETLAFPPLSIVKSKNEVVKCDTNTIFLLEIYDPFRNFSSEWLYNGFDNTTKHFYIELLHTYMQHNLIHKSIYIQSMSSEKDAGITVTFIIEIPLNIIAPQEQTLEHYSSQLQRLFPLGSNLSVTLTGNFVVKSLRNLEYCLEYSTEVNYTNCTSQIIKWPRTLASHSAISTPKCTICLEDRLLKRLCIKDEFLGAYWSTETLEIFKSPACFAEKAVGILKHEYMENKTSELINEFDNLFKNKKEVMQQTSTHLNVTVSYLRTSLKLLLGFKYNVQNDTKLHIITSNTTDANADMPDIIVLFSNGTLSHLTSLSDTYMTVAVFKNIFPNSENFTVASPVIHVDLNAATTALNHFSAYFKLNHTEMVQDYECGNWDLNYHKWNTENGIYMGYDNGYHHCIFNHNTENDIYMDYDNTYHHTVFKHVSFALLFKATAANRATMSIISLIGCVLSVLGLLLLIFVHICFTKRHKNNYDRELLVNLAVSLLCMYLLFIFGFNQTHAETVCIINGALLHYFTLASFCWMMVKAYDAYLKYVRVLGSHICQFLLKASIVAWGIPAIIVLTVASTDYKLFRDDHSCHVHSYAFYYAFLLPIGVVVIINMCIFLLILINVLCRRTKLRTHQKKKNLPWLEIRMLISIFILFGLTWIFGFLAAVHNSPVFSYLFCITSPLQGFFMFFLYVVVNRRIQKGWRYINCITRTDENVYSGTTGSAMAS